MVAPFTEPLSERQLQLKQEQIRAKSGPRGPSKLLSKFMPDDQRKVLFSVFILLDRTLLCLS